MASKTLIISAEESLLTDGGTVQSSNAGQLGGEDPSPAGEGLVATDGATRRRTQSCHL
jgi:hypothetical protein